MRSFAAITPNWQDENFDFILQPARLFYDEEEF